MTHETRYIDCIEPHQKPKTLIVTSHFSGLSSSLGPHSFLLGKNGLYVQWFREGFNLYSRWRQLV